MMLFLAILTIGLAPTHALDFDTFDEGRDLEFFLSAPNIRPPKINVTYVNEDRVNPGYWFLASYDYIYQDPASPKLEACQVGPLIYDNSGQLVWSGACDVQNGNVFVFDRFEREGKQFLNLLFRGRSSTFAAKKVLDRRGLGVILDDAFDAVEFVHTRAEDKEFNMHEFLITPHYTALMLLGVPTETELPPALGANNKEIWAWLGGFREVDIKTGNVLFDWKLLDHMSLAETTTQVPTNTSDKQAWDWFHPNSVDRDPDGNYLFSGRFTDTIYKISGQDGSIIWRLGGRNSSFELDGFNFSRQHDARFLSQSGSKLTISFLNNGGDGKVNSAITSSGLIVELDEQQMTARVVTEWLRPDGRLSALRGNVQVLENGCAFIGWSGNGYLSEHTPEGEILLEAQFASHRLTSYRSMKRPFVGKPQYPPSLVGYVHGQDVNGSVTTVHVSWNGATEVYSWVFYGLASLEGEPQKLGTLRKTGFETKFTVSAFHAWVYAEALASDGSVLAGSPHVKTAIPTSWGPLKQEAKGKVETAYLDGWHLAELGQIDTEQVVNQESLGQESTLQNKFDNAVTRFKGSNLLSLAVGAIVGALVALGASHFMGRVRKIPKRTANGGSYELVGMNGHQRYDD